MIKPITFGFGTAVLFVEKFFNAVWIVICRLCLQPLLTVGLIWLFLAAFLPDEKMTMELIIVFVVLMGLAAGYAVAATARNVWLYLKNGASRRKDKPSEEEEALPQKRKKSSPPPQAVEEETVIKQAELKISTATEPLYYRVAQNPKYVMAEYPDRYELYYDDGGKLKFVKVNIKNQEDR